MDASSRRDSAGPGPLPSCSNWYWCGPSRDDALALFKQVDLLFLRGVLDVRWPIALGPLIIVVVAWCLRLFLKLAKFVQMTRSKEVTFVFFE